MHIKKSIIIILSIFVANVLYSQLSIGIAFGGIGYHPKKDSNSKFYRWKIDRKGKFVGYSSISLIINYRYNQNVGFKLNHTYIFHDCAGKKAGVTHFGINLYDDILGWKNNIHEFSLSFGPMWYYRKNWSLESGYTNNPKFMTILKNRIWERKFVWHGGTIEYNYYYSKNNSISTSILPGYPYLYTAIFGINTKISKLK